MIIGMPIFIHEKLPIYWYTKTITINQESYQFFPNIQLNVSSSINTNLLPKRRIWIQRDNQMELIMKGQYCMKKNL